MKEKILLFIYLLFYFLKITYQQPIIIPLDPEDSEGNEKKDNNNKNIKEQNDDEKPLIITQELKGKDGSNIRITRIHYGRSKNLNGKKSEGVTPFQIMRIFDDRVNSIFEDMIRESLGLKLLLNGLSMIDDENDYEDRNNTNNTNDEKSIFEEFELDDDEEENNKNVVENKNITNNIKSKKNEKRILKKDKNKNEKKINKFGKLKINMDNVKKKMKKGKKQLSRKEIIFSRVCKYIFYSIILFTIYILVKKLLEVLEIIDPDNQVEVKIENDETSKLKKNSENKQS